MKKYIVVSKIDVIIRLEETFNIPEDADKYAEIMNRTHPHHRYYVYTLKEDK